MRVARFIKGRKRSAASDKKAPLSEHLGAFRRMIIGCLMATLIGMILCYELFRSTVMHLAVKPFEKIDSTTLVYTAVSESFTTEMWVSLLAGAILMSPLIFFFIWNFIGPAFFAKEKRQIFKYTLIAVLLFCTGVAFGYFILIPFTLNFLTGVSSVEASAMISISNYIGFLCKILASFGLVFETPLVMYFVVSYDLIGVKALTKTRKYIVLVCFCLAAIITPPDVVSQLYVAAPMYLMFEIGLAIGRIRLWQVNRKVRKKANIIKAAA